MKFHREFNFLWRERAAPGPHKPSKTPPDHLRSNSGSLAIFTAIRRASWRVSNFAADLRPGSSAK